MARQLYSCIARQLYSQTVMQLYSCIARQLYSQIVIQPDSYIVVQLYSQIVIQPDSYIVVQLYSLHLYFKSWLFLSVCFKLALILYLDQIQTKMGERSWGEKGKRGRGGGEEEKEEKEEEVEVRFGKYLKGGKIQARRCVLKIMEVVVFYFDLIFLVLFCLMPWKWTQRNPTYSCQPLTLNPPPSM